MPWGIFKKTPFGHQNVLYNLTPKDLFDHISLSITRWEIKAYSPRLIHSMRPQGKGLNSQLFL